jgi:hypothetical protein
MGWLRNKVRNAAVSAQGRELQSFIDMLTSLDGYDIGMTVAMISYARHVLEKTYKVDLLDPVTAIAARPNMIIEVGSLVADLQKSNKPAVAAGFIVWVHTLRAAHSLELRQLGRDLWGQLQRGFPHVQACLETLPLLIGDVPMPENVATIPIGFSPTPLR